MRILVALILLVVSTCHGAIRPGDQAGTGTGGGSGSSTNLEGQALVQTTNIALTVVGANTVTVSTNSFYTNANKLYNRALMWRDAVVFDDFDGVDTNGVNTGLTTSGHTWSWNSGVISNGFQRVGGMLRSTNTAHDYIVRRYMSNAIAFKRVGQMIHFRPSGGNTNGNQYWALVLSTNAALNQGRVELYIHSDGTLHITTNAYTGFVTNISLPTGFAYGDRVPMEMTLVSNRIFVAVGPYNVVVHWPHWNWNFTVNESEGYGSQFCPAQEDLESVWMGHPRAEQWAIAQGLFAIYNDPFRIDDGDFVFGGTGYGAFFLENATGRISFNSIGFEPVNPTFNLGRIVSPWSNVVGQIFYVVNKVTYQNLIVSGAGNGSSNYTLLAGRTMYLGSSNVNITAVMDYDAVTTTEFSSVNITNLSASPWGLSFSPETNRWFFSGVYGTNAPTVLTNNTRLVMSIQHKGSNAWVGYTYYSPAQ